ncbi:type A chloramphenicol O-acetyltransferase [Campylobacter lari]|nr:type A chloramphenicol O-acetyltransferase [Campylobacter lari]
MKIIDLKTYSRKEHFEFYTKFPCYFELNVKLDISKFYSFVKNQKYSFYGSFIYFLSKNVNLIPEFKLYLEDDKLICFDIIHPSYTAFCEKSKTFCVLWTEFNEDFQNFLHNFEHDKQLIKENTMFVKENIKNSFNISAIPWINFENFSLHLPKKENYFFPILTSGKIIKEKNQCFIPLSINVNHASTDAYHVSLFLENLQKDLNCF